MREADISPDTAAVLGPGEQLEGAQLLGRLPELLAALGAAQAG